VSVSAVEVKSGTIAASSTATVTIATSLTTNDRVVAIIYKTGTTGTPTATGLGTWTAEVSGTGTVDHYMFSMSGVTGGGNITLGVGAAVSGDYVVYVLRSSISAAVTKHGATQSASTSDTGSVVNSCTANMFACVASMVTGGATITGTYPGASAVPSSGWTLDYTGGNTATKYASVTLLANANVQSGGTASASTTWVNTLGVFTDGDTSTPTGPLTNTFVGWGYPIF
jgi:hypothetical protein